MYVLLYGLAKEGTYSGYIFFYITSGQSNYWSSKFMTTPTKSLGQPRKIS
jgi:hypothetical protein